MNRFAFLKQMFSSGMTGNASSKRGAMGWFILLFTATVIVNLSTSGRVHLTPTLEGQLYEAVKITIRVVFGEPALKLITMFFQGKQKPPTEGTDPIVPDENELTLR